MGPDCRCPLCDAAAPLFARLPRRPVHACPECRLLFVPEQAHVSREREMARYRLHRNSPDDAGYRRFLHPAVDSLKRAARPGGRVLDYGCGPAPVLVAWLRQEGFDAVGYDPFFAPDTDLTGAFDAVVAVETFEHFRHPRTEIERIARLLVPGGALVVLTALWTPDRDLTTWPYATDETHVAFYTEATFRFMASAWGFDLIETDGVRRVALLKTA